VRELMGGEERVRGGRERESKSAPTELSQFGLTRPGQRLTSGPMLFIVG
jgi:hypothetical protein